VTVRGPDAGASDKTSRRVKNQPRRNVVDALGKTVRLHDKDQWRWGSGGRRGQMASLGVRAHAIRYRVRAYTANRRTAIEGVIDADSIAACVGSSWPVCQFLDRLTPVGDWPRRASPPINWPTTEQTERLETL
jgi:hypothetical protein